MAIEVLGKRLYPKKIKPLEDQAKDALERSKNAHRMFEATLRGAEKGSLKIQALKEVLELVQSVDKGLLEIEVQVRQEKIRNIQVTQEPELPGADQERKIALKILKELLSNPQT